MNTPWTDADKDEVQGETEKLVTEMTEAEKESEMQVEFEDKGRLGQKMATRRIVPRARRRCGGRQRKSTQRRAELASLRQWLTRIGS